mmetsp:Transcript_19166/g.21704  ORF Transcript_19166/g.21704 Transcript_19166/m.21704 type:complete len:103 (+) Transcript_19166:301-609(+)
MLFRFRYQTISLNFLIIFTMSSISLNHRAIGFFCPFVFLYEKSQEALGILLFVILNLRYYYQGALLIQLERRTPRKKRRKQAQLKANIKEEKKSTKTQNKKT